MRKCLLIDDDLDDQDIFKMCLNEATENVNFASVMNGVEAISLLTNDSKYTPGYIFIDMNMPRMNGIECLKKVKEIDRLKQSRVFMYSTTAENRMVVESKELGAEDFIVKPSKLSELKQVLARIFDAI